VRPTVRLLTASACLASLAVGTVAANAGLTPVDLTAVSSYLSTHGVTASSEVLERRIAGATPRAECGPGSLPETARQGRVPLAEYESGRAAQGYTCNAEQVGHYGEVGGFQVHRYLDVAGNECAYYDSTLLFPLDKAVTATEPGIYVLDMSDPANPERTAFLPTYAGSTPHESLRLNEARGLLAAVGGSPLTQLGIVDVWDVSADCRQPVLRSTTPLGFLGHESGMSVDGNTFWVAATAQPHVIALDISDPVLPTVLWQSSEWTSHGMSLSEDGNRLYVTDMDNAGITILDVSEIQARTADPQVREISKVTWPEASIPQNSIPVTIKGKKYLVEVDEYSRNVTSYDPMSPVGAARILDISDETEPKVVSNLRLEVHQPEARRDDQRDDPGAQYGVQGYAGHYCSVPQREDPGIVACSFILSGLRVFDIRNPEKPKEIAYFNQPAPLGFPLKSGAYAMSAPAFAPDRGEIWYSDGNSGFYNVRLTNGVWPGRK
jgi:hypothetical protein